ncbi:MAG TPA: 2-oxo acid dehydrogenase subunit E2, partial [Planctomycetota bacterium]|nr:2-oxo acid dehydrogenase subunit E2 [Planctomycetota bacterium]
MQRPDFEDLFGLNAAYAEKVYGDYLAAPDSVTAEWRQWFESTLPPELRARGGAVRTPPPPAPAAASSDELQPLVGVAGRIVRNMTESLSVPTATSVREIPVKVLEENRHAINRHQQGLYLGKISFTHLIGWAMVQAILRVPAMQAQFVEQDGKPFRRVGKALNVGIA